MSALANFRGDRRILAFGPDGVLWRRRFTLEKAEQHVRLKRATAQRNRRGVIICIHFYSESRKPLHSRFKAGTRYSHIEMVGCRRRWTHRNLPPMPVAAGLSAGEFLEQVDLERRSAFQSTLASVQVEAPQTQHNSRRQ